MAQPQFSGPSPFARLARRITQLAGSTAGFFVALVLVLAWLVSGPFFGFSDTWQLVINTSTTIVTFLMVFLIQRTQNKDSLALQMKLNELVAATKGASNRLVSIEDVTEEELEALHRHYAHLARRAAEESDLLRSHSIDEADERHGEKHGSEGNRSAASEAGRG